MAIKVSNLFVIGYEYETAYGRTIRKVVLCESVEEYKRIRARIEEGNAKMLTFDELMDSHEIE